ncbi:hypothetical protein HD554DRAFT_2034322 [Boletus coccyginus]|nr:hypothetical protein HD554DRAFT_2034322 [Boletus coccyginus]
MKKMTGGKAKHIQLQTCDLHEPAPARAIKCSRSDTATEDVHPSALEATSTAKWLRLQTDVLAHDTSLNANNVNGDCNMWMDQGQLCDTYRDIVSGDNVHFQCIGYYWIAIQRAMSEQKNKNQGEKPTLKGYAGFTHNGTVVLPNYLKIAGKFQLSTIAQVITQPTLIINLSLEFLKGVLAGTLLDHSFCNYFSPTSLDVLQIPFNLGLDSKVDNWLALVLLSLGLLTCRTYDCMVFMITNYMDEDTGDFFMEKDENLKEFSTPVDQLSRNMLIHQIGFAAVLKHLLRDESELDMHTGVVHITPDIITYYIWSHRDIQPCVGMGRRKWQEAMSWTMLLPMVTSTLSKEKKDEAEVATKKWNEDGANKAKQSMYRKKNLRKKANHFIELLRYKTNASEGRSNMFSVALIEDLDVEDKDSDEAPEDVVHEIFWLAYHEFNLILTPMVQTLFLIQLIKKPKILVPWLLLAKSAKDYVDMNYLPEGFVVADPSKFIKKVLDKLWAHWASHHLRNEPILQFIRAFECLQVHKKWCYVEVASSDDEQELVVGKDKASDVSMSGEAGPLSAGHPLSKWVHLLGFYQYRLLDFKGKSANLDLLYSYRLEIESVALLDIERAGKVVLVMRDVCVRFEMKPNDRDWAVEEAQASSGEMGGLTGEIIAEVVVRDVESFKEVNKEDEEERKKGSTAKKQPTPLSPNRSTRSMTHK